MYVQRDTLLLADVFENFIIYEPDSTYFLTALGLAWQTVLKTTKAKLGLLTDIGVLSVTDTGIRGGIFHSIYWYAKANNKYMKYYDENKEFLYSILVCK